LSAVFGDYRKPVVNRIGIGDSVQINIWETGAGGIFSADRGFAQGLQSPQAASSVVPEQVVSSDGSITVPYAGRIKVAGKSPRQVEDLIVGRLEGRSAQPQVLVSLTKSLSNSVTVTGDVTAGARVSIDGAGQRLLDVITQAGGIRSAVYETSITLTRDGQSFNVPMLTLLSNPAENIFVRAGDTIALARFVQSFTAVGATGQQSLVHFDAAGLTLEEALGKAGGLINEQADPHGVFVLRYEPAALVRSYPGVPDRLLAGGVVPVAYHINMRDPASLFYARRFAMRDKDILYVSTAPLTDFEKITRAFGNLTAPSIQAATAYTAYYRAATVN
jgi:polysaccharide export outer membrane protein